MYKNFASQPPAYLFGGSLTADDLKSQVAPNGDFFERRTNFVECENVLPQKENFLPQKENFLNADAKKGVDWGGYISQGLNMFGNYQQQQLTDSAIDLQQQQNTGDAIQLQREKIELEKEKEKSSVIKSYGIPIAIAGGVIIIGIATYFIFRKKSA